MRVAIDNNRTLGVVRCDRTDDAWLTSINIAPAERGKGYGSRALTEATNGFRATVGDHRLLAEIRADNEASLHPFQKGRFIWQGQKDELHRLVHFVIDPSKRLHLLSDKS